MTLTDFLTDIPLAPLTTTKVGGPAKFFLTVTTDQQLVDVINQAKSNNLKYLILGGGSNVLISDNGFDGAVIHNQISDISSSADLIMVGSGMLLQQLVDYTIDQGFGGLHKMTGIPGTVGGAIYGNAEAYQQHISDYLVSIKVFDGQQIIEIDPAIANFSYRDSEFKRNGLIILGATFKLPKADKLQIQQESAETLTKRLERYPTYLHYPGSFFKNVIVDQVSTTALAKIPADKIRHNRIFVGYLLESVGSQGRSLGHIKVTDYHANLLINDGQGTAAEYWQLAHQLKQAVYQQFEISIEPEVQLINLPPL